MTDVSAELVRFALPDGDGRDAAPEELRAAVPGLPDAAAATGPAATAAPVSPAPVSPAAGLEGQLAALRSAYPPGDPRARALDSAAALAGSGTHPLLAAVAAVARVRGGERAAGAAVLGCEVACRLARSLGVRPEALAVVGAALAGSTERRGGLHALGLAATQATTVNADTADAGDRDGITALSAAFAAADGIEAALLGGRGFTAPPEPLEGRRGLLALLAPGAEAPELLRDLGTVWHAETVLRPAGVPADGPRR